VAEMEERILANIEVKDDDLRSLAHRRSEKVKDYLADRAGIKPERLFVVEPKSPPSQSKKDLKDSRVEFTLQ
jgi:hypothetical protein